MNLPALPPPPADAQATDRCPRCGGGFHCGVQDTQPCPCGTVTLSPALRASLRAQYSGCLCLACLSELSEQSTSTLPPGPWPDRPDTRHDPLEGTTTDGRIVTGASRQRVVPAFQAVLSSAIAQVLAAGEGHALYLYGSVATGTAQLGRSDVDLVAVGPSPAVAARISQSLSTDFAHLCRSVDIGAAQPADYDAPGDEAHGNRVFLRHYCVHLAGPDLRPGLPDFAADQAAARGFNGDIGQCAARWQTELLQATPPRLLARRIARKTLLAVAGLVSVHDHSWTTDRALAAWRWGQLRPTLAQALRELLAWSEAAVPDASSAAQQGALSGVVADVVSEFRQHIGLWR